MQRVINTITIFYKTTYPVRMVSSDELPKNYDFNKRK